MDARAWSAFGSAAAGSATVAQRSGPEESVSASDFASDWPAAGREVPDRRTRFWHQLAGVGGGALGGAVLAGWAIDAQAMIGLMPRLAPMQPITAICMLIAGASVWGVARGNNRWALLGLPLLLIGFATLYQFGTGHDLGIDRLLFASVIADQPGTQIYPGRMAQATAVLLVLLALALAAITSNGRLTRAALWLATGGVTGCGVVLAGYIAGGATLRAVGMDMQMSLLTALGMAAMFAAIASMAAPDTAHSVGTASLAQRLISAMLPLRRTPLWLRVAGAVALPVAAMAMRQLLGIPGHLSPMAPFVPAVVVAAFLLGPGAGAIAAVTSTVLGRMQFAPVGSVAVVSPRDEGLLLLFLFIFLIVATAIDLLFSALERVASDAAALRRQASLIDQSQDAILAWTPDGRIIHWNRGAERLYGHDAAQAMGRSRHELLASAPPVNVAQIKPAVAQDGRWVGDSVHRARDGRRVVVESRHALVQGADGRMVVLETNRDLTAKRAAERQAADLELRLAAIIDALPIGISVCEAPSGRIVMGNRATEAIVRHPIMLTPDLAGYADWEAYHADGRRLAPADYPMAQVLATGARAECEMRYRRGDGSFAWLRVVGAPLRDLDDVLVGCVIGIVDVDEERRLVEQQRLLVAELSHRVKNMLAVVQAIASSTLRRSTSLPGFAAAFEGRLQALALAHTQLLRTDWQGAQLQALIAAVLAPHADAERLEIAGAEVVLSARQGVSLALVLHELATNAARHGALAVPAGRLSIRWDVAPGDDGQPWLHLHWQERGLPALPAIGQAGLGLQLIRRSVESDLDGRAVLVLADDRLQWDLAFAVAAPNANDTAREDAK